MRQAARWNKNWLRIWYINSKKLITNTSVLLHTLFVIRCGVSGLILNQHRNYFTIFWWLLYKARHPHGSRSLPRWETLSCNIIFCGYDELPCLSLFNPAPELVDRDKSAAPASEALRHTEAQQWKCKHIFYTALPWSELMYYLLPHLMERVSRACINKIFHCVVIKYVVIWNGDKIWHEWPQIKVLLCVLVILYKVLYSRTRVTDEAYLWRKELLVVKWALKDSVHGVEHSESLHFWTLSIIKNSK
jgi:hypothetical protein